MSDVGKQAADNAGRLVGRIVSMIESGDRASLAALKKGGSSAYPIVFPLIEDVDNRTHAENVGLLIGQAMGIRRGHSPNFGNFGRSMRSLWLEKKRSDGVKNSANKIIRSGERTTLNRELISMMRRMSASNTLVDFHRLYRDVYVWNDLVARKWASTFYQEEE
jgi:hypothetical protein